MFDIDTLLNAWSQHNWPIVSAGIILILVYLAKMPIAGKIWDKVPKQYRPLIPVVLSILSGIGEALFRGTPWVAAILYNLIAGLSTIGVDQATTKPLLSRESP